MIANDAVCSKLPPQSGAVQLIQPENTPIATAPPTTAPTVAAIEIAPSGQKSSAPTIAPTIAETTYFVRNRIMAESLTQPGISQPDACYPPKVPSTRDPTGHCHPNPAPELATQESGSVRSLKTGRSGAKSHVFAVRALFTEQRASR